MARRLCDQLGIWEDLKKKGIVDEAKEQAITEGSRLKEAAQSDIAQEVNRAKEGLRSQVALLALAGAEKVLQASVDENAHREIVDNLAANL